MVDATAAAVAEIKLAKKARMDELYEKRADYPLNREEDDGNMSVRVVTETMEDGSSKFIMLTECKLVPGGYKPNDFAWYPDTWQDVI